MEGLGAEVSAKIRSAIKAKLIELEAYVDEELPDYIMVMVANNRNKDQMEDDLGLFLNNNTKAFTNWLHAVLEKLKKVTLDEVSKKESKKKKVKKTSASEKSSSKKPAKEAKDTKEKKSRSEKKSAKSSSSKAEKSSKNANLEELGDRRKKKSSTSGSLDDSGGKGDYDPAELLKSAVDKSKSKTSPRKSSSKRSGESRGSEGKSRNMINLREEEDFYRSHGGERGERERRGGLVSIVSKVVRPDRDRDREREREWEREREKERYRERERYPVRRARSRSQPEDDRDYEEGGGVTRSVVSRAQVPPRPSRPPGREERGVARAVSRAMLEADKSIVRRVREEDREDVARLSADDARRYEFLKRRREEREEREMRELKEVRQRERDLRDRQREEEVRLRHRRQTDQAGPAVARARSQEVSPPKKRKLDEDDAELLEMRRKALESLMKRTDKELVRTRVDSGDRKIVEDVSSDSSDSDSDLSLSELDTSKEPEPEPTFIVTMDGIDEDYFNGEMKPKPKAVMARKAEKMAESAASSDAELELHADVNFDEGENKKSVRTKAREPAEKPTMKVAARKRSPILPPTGGGTRQPVAAVKPLPKSQSKSVNATKLAASYAAKLSEIKANKAKLKGLAEPSGTLEKNNSTENPAAKPPLRKTISVDKSKPTLPSVPAVKPKPTEAAVKPNPAKPKRVPIKAPSPERSSPNGVSRLSYGNSVPAGTSSNISTSTTTAFAGNSSKYKWKATHTSTTTAFAGNSNKYKWKAGI